MLLDFFKKKLTRKKNDFQFEPLRVTWKELPGYAEPSLEELKFEAVNFERIVKKHLTKKGCEISSGARLSECIEMLKGFPFHPEYVDVWNKRIEEFHELRKLRNRIVHSKYSGLPEVKELYHRFRDANRMLRPLEFCSGDMTRFEDSELTEDAINLKIDGNSYLLSWDDVNNLLCELETDYRGKVNFTKGRMVVAKIHDYEYKDITYYIEGYNSFTIDHDEAATLSDFLSSAMGYADEIRSKRIG